MHPLVISVSTGGNACTFEVDACHHDEELFTVLIADKDGAVIPNGLTGMVSVCIACIACHQVAFNADWLMPFAQREHAIVNRFSGWNQTEDVPTGFLVSVDFVKIDCSCSRLWVKWVVPLFQIHTRPFALEHIRGLVKGH